MRRESEFSSGTTRAKSSNRLKRLRRAITSLCAFVFVACGSGSRSQGASESLSNESGDRLPVTVFAASGLRLALAEIAREYQSLSGDSVTLVFGSTVALQEQILQGAPADVFIAADPDAIDSLSSQGLAIDSSRHTFAEGRLVMVFRCKENPRPAGRCSIPDGTSDVRDLADSVRFRSIAIADPRYAPYGAAAKQALEHARVWNRISSRLITGASVMQAWQYVETGNADVALVALSLVALDSTHAHIVVDPSYYTPPVHEVSVLNGSRQPRHASAFVEFLMSQSSQGILRKYGFADPASMR